MHWNRLLGDWSAAVPRSRAPEGMFCATARVPPWSDGGTVLGSLTNEIGA
jgi:hypothetical protein